MAEDTITITEPITMAAVMELIVPKIALPLDAPMLFATIEKSIMRIKTALVLPTTSVVAIA